MNDPIKEFAEEKVSLLKANKNNIPLQEAAHNFNVQSNAAKYSYNFTWMGRPIIQYPQDMIAMQELIWEIKPDLIIETGIAHGGSIIYYASLLELIGNGEVLGIDIDIREHNKKKIEAHSMYKRIHMLEGSSISNEMIEKIKAFAFGKDKVLVCLDSNHTHDHVLSELKLYAPFVTLNSYIIVFDTIVEYLPESYLPNRSWSLGNNPQTAVNEFLQNNNNFLIDYNIDHKLLISENPGGYLKRVK